MLDHHRRKRFESLIKIEKEQINKEIRNEIKKKISPIIRDKKKGAKKKGTKANKYKEKLKREKENMTESDQGLEDAKLKS